MKRPRTVGVYRALVRLYPRSFRDEYGTDMVQIFAHQLRDEAAPRVWARGVVDLAVTVPIRHLEVHMKHPPNVLVPLLFAMLGTVGLIVAIIGGSSPGTLVAGITIAALGGILALVSWRRGRPVVETRGATAQWWKLVAGGGAALGAMIVAERATDLSLWYPMLFTVVLALVAIAVGVILGVARLVGPSRGAART